MTINSNFTEFKEDFVHSILLNQKFQAMIW